MERRDYAILIVLNGRRFNRLIIDQHYREKHKTIDDNLIIQLVGQLHGKRFEPESKSRDSFEYYTEDKMRLETKLYKLIWTLESQANYIGVINCYRRA